MWQVGNDSKLMSGVKQEQIPHKLLYCTLRKAFVLHVVDGVHSIYTTVFNVFVVVHSDLDATGLLTLRIELDRDQVWHDRYDWHD